MKSPQAGGRWWGLAVMVLVSGCATPATKFTPVPEGTPLIRLETEQTRVIDVFPSLAGYANPPTVTFPAGVYRPDAWYTAPQKPEKQGILYKAPGMLVTKGVPDLITGTRQYRGWLFVNKRGAEWIGVMIEGYQAPWWEDYPPHGLKGEPIQYRVVQEGGSE